MMEPIYAALERGEKLNIYFELAGDFHGLDSGALWQDMRGPSAPKRIGASGPPSLPPPCPSTRSRRSSIAPPRRRASSRAERAGACAPREWFPMRTSKRSARSSTRFWRPRVRATSIGSWRCSTRTSSCAPILGRSAARGRLAGPPRSRARRSATPRWGWTSDPRLVNGVVGALAFLHGQPFSFGAVTVRNGKIVELDFLRDPERLRQLDLTILDDRGRDDRDRADQLITPCV
jgi:hypothetical protein